MQNLLHLYFATLFWLIPSLFLAQPHSSLLTKIYRTQHNQTRNSENLYSYGVQHGHHGRDERHSRDWDNETLTIDKINIELAIAKMLGTIKQDTRVLFLLLE